MLCCGLVHETSNEPAGSNHTMVFLGISSFFFFFFFFFKLNY